MERKISLREIALERRRQISLNAKNGDSTSLDGKTWLSYGSSIDEYQATFVHLLPEGIVESLSKRKFPVAVDIMSPSSALRSLSSRLSNGLGIGVCVSLEDLRTAKEKDYDSWRNIKQIAGDILDKKTWKKLESVTERADMVFVRPLSGLRCIPMIPIVYYSLLNRAWQLLNKKGGMLLVQCPSSLKLTENGINPEEWAMFLKKNGMKDDDFLYESDCLKLIKRSYSPKKLPFLNP